ncbi:2-phosphoxylose phosphatase 1-like isoform X1 [Montipora foliosa]|uniref:2-phosphoxylose phosphatase 1-like isoform X1 n=1 Tax=Montipora foliosa TaxID=591990 RepID=UPI0035F13974
MIPVLFVSLRRRMFYWKYRFQRLDQLWKIIIFGLLALFVWIWVWNASKSESATPYVIPNSVQQHVVNYCNFPMRTAGSEGSLSVEELLNQRRFQLEMVQMVIRHGDRSQAIHIPNMDTRKYDFDCTFDTTDPERKQLFDNFRQVASHFKLRDLASGRKIINSLVPLGKRCEIGQLSQKGFLQHFELGKHMRTTYIGLIGNKIVPANLHVRSTARSRCIQSGAAFLFGLLTKDTITSEGMTINVTADTWLREDDNGIPYSCPKLMKHWAEYKQRREYVAQAAEMEPFMQKYAQILSTSRSALPTVVFLTDAILTRYCHKHPLPCGRGGCVSQEMAAEGIDFASWAMSENYTGIADLATHPMLIQMAKRMTDKARQKSMLKFVLYSGHDSTVVPLMLNLGVHDRKRWTPYATRVVFELWRDYRAKGLEATSLDPYYFRVLVNGKVVTSKMKFCGDALFKGELCPVTELISWLSSGKGMDETYRSLCSM